MIGFVEVIDGVVGGLDRLHRPGVVVFQGVHGLAQHVGDLVAEIERLAHGTGQRLGGRVEHVGVEMARPAGIVGLRPGGHQPPAESGQGVVQRQEDDGCHQAEGGVEVH